MPVIGARVALGISILLYYVPFVPDFFYYFAPGGMVDPALIETPGLSLVLLFWNPAASVVLFALLVLGTVGFTLGLFSRWLVYPLFALQISFHHANPYVIHEPQQLTNLLLLMFFFLPRGNDRKARTDPRILAALVAYLGVYYFLAGAKKLADPLWRSGESLWYLIQWPPFHVDGLVSRFLVAHPSICRLASWGTLAFEMLFLALAFTRVRPFLILGGAALHLGIGLTMQVGNFWYALAPWYALLFDDKTRRFFRWRK